MRFVTGFSVVGMSPSPRLRRGRAFLDPNINPQVSMKAYGNMAQFLLELSKCRFSPLGASSEIKQKANGHVLPTSIFCPCSDVDRLLTCALPLTMIELFLERIISSSWLSGREERRSFLSTRFPKGAQVTRTGGSTAARRHSQEDERERERERKREREGGRWYTCNMLTSSKRML